MADESFEILAAKVLAGEAAPPEVAELEARLAREPALREEFAQLKVAHNVLREFGPMAVAMNAPPVPVPRDRLRRLQATVRQARAEQATQRAAQVAEPVRLPFHAVIRRWIRSHQLVAATAAAALLIGVYLVNEIFRSSRGAKPSAILARQSGPAPSADTAGGMSNLLSLPLPQFLANIQLIRPPAGTRTAANNAIYSPSSSTRNLQPWIIWKTETGKAYDITITDEFDKRTPPWRVTGTVSPLDSSKVDAWKDRPFAKGGLYRLRIHETGQPISPTEIAEMTFQVLDDATAAPAATPAATPEEKIARARQILTTEPVCYGDALGELLALPPELAETELPLKMKAIAFGRLGFQEERAAAVERLKAATNSPKP